MVSIIDTRPVPQPDGATIAVTDPLDPAVGRSRLARSRTVTIHRGALDPREETRPGSVLGRWQPSGWGDARHADGDLDRRRRLAYHRHWRPQLLSPRPDAGRFAPRWARDLFADEIASATARGRSYGHAL